MPNSAITNPPRHAAEVVATSPAHPEPAQLPPRAEGEQKTPEFNGPKGPEPTRFGDWERKGRCIDF